MTKFPLCEELGLTIETRYILAADLERLLSQAAETFYERAINQNYYELIKERKWKQ